MTAFDQAALSEPLRVFHPPGVVRVVTPAEAQDDTTHPSTGNWRAAVSRAAEVLRSFARVWVEAQAHRAGL